MMSSDYGLMRDSRESYRSDRHAASGHRNQKNPGLRPEALMLMLGNLSDRMLSPKAHDSANYCRAVSSYDLADG
jgi:hypothetical protein